LRLRLRWFKTFDKLSLELKPFTVLIGPPASGKSNLLEALALLGLPGKLAMLTDQYTSPDTFCQAEPTPMDLLRIGEAIEVLPWMDYRDQPLLELEAPNGHRLALRLAPRGPSLYAEYETGSAISIQIPFHSAAPGNEQYCNAIIEAASSLGRMHQSQGEGNALIEARLYGYERYGIETRVEQVTRCANNTCLQPRDVLAETGHNLAHMASSSPKPLRWLQDWLSDAIGAPIEIRVRTRMPKEVLFFSREIEVPTRLLSDTLLRVLYYLLALYTAARHTKQYGLKGRVLVLLEEPEARAFPYSFELLAAGIREALNAGAYIALTTHNGLLLSKLLDTVRSEELAVYYMYPGSEGYSRTLPVSVERLAEKMLLLEDLLLMKPGEVLQELGEATGKKH